MTRYVCIHAHCYQPPRENPWLEEVEPQDSAYPYHDWNERVNAECYAQNVAARILDGEGWIARIVNNLSNISFNIGPTLLSWMEQHDADTYHAILEADRESRKRFSGHGSALAQVYNHMIMPLASERDQRTQVVWGIRDFERRFGRRPEGMWLAETAVDVPTLELLAEHGILFTILSPYQARRVRPLAGDGNNDSNGSDGAQRDHWAAASAQQPEALDEAQAEVEAEAHDEAWVDVEGGRIDPSRAYVHKLPSGRSIALFFYDGPVARAVAFERLLDSGESFAQRLMTGFSDLRSWPQLMHIATDGESYGHHHRHGEMALAYALDFMSRTTDVKLTVYGEFLENHPPTHEVEIIESTAWSCSHGVGRWQNDCGCNSGRPGWRQTWRRPLREALDWLRDSLVPRYEDHAGQLFHDPWAARDGYIDAILDRSRDNVDSFLRRHARRSLSATDKQRALMLLELQRQAMLMYTSCGWFFDELSGIETVQVIQYAGRAVQLASMLFGDRLEEQFMNYLARAPSNLPDWRDGRVVYERAVKPAVVGLSKVAAHYAVSSLFDAYPEHARVYCYDIKRLAEDRHEAGQVRMIVGRARVTSEITWNSLMVGYAVVHFGDTHVLGGVTEELAAEEWQRMTDGLLDALSRSDLPRVVATFDGRFREQFALPGLFRDQQRKVLTQLLDATLERADAAMLDIYRENATLIRFLAMSNMPVPRTLQTAASRALTHQLERALEGDELDRPRLEELLAEARERNIALDQTTLEFALEQRIEAMARRFGQSPLDVGLLQALSAWVAVVEIMPFEVDLWQVQNIYYKLSDSVLGAQRRRLDAGDEQARRWCELFIVLGQSLRVRVEGHGDGGA